MLVEAIFKNTNTEELTNDFSQVEDRLSARADVRILYKGVRTFRPGEMIYAGRTTTYCYDDGSELTLLCPLHRHTADGKWQMEATAGWGMMDACRIDEALYSINCAKNYLAASYQEIINDIWNEYNI